MRGFLAGVVRKRLKLDLESAVSRVSGSIGSRLSMVRRPRKRSRTAASPDRHAASQDRCGGPETSSVEAEIARLRGLDAKVLRARWRTSFGQDAPTHVARHLLFAMLAYRLQAEAMGDLDAETVRFLKQVDLAPSKQAAVPLTQAFERRRRDLSPGTVLTREWSGQHHRVMVLTEASFGRGGLIAACQKLPRS